MLETVTVKLTLLPMLTVWLWGCWLMMGGWPKHVAEKASRVNTSGRTEKFRHSKRVGLSGAAFPRVGNEAAISVCRRTKGRKLEHAAITGDWIDGFMD